MHTHTHSTSHFFYHLKTHSTQLNWRHSRGQLFLHSRAEPATQRRRLFFSLSADHQQQHSNSLLTSASFQQLLSPSPPPGTPFSISVCLPVPLSPPTAAAFELRCHDTTVAQLLLALCYPISGATILNSDFFLSLHFLPTCHHQHDAFLVWDVVVVIPLWS